MPQLEIPDDDPLFEDVADLLKRKDFLNFEMTDVTPYWHPSVDFSEKHSKRVEQEFFERTVNAAWLAHLSDHGVSAGSIVQEDPDLPIDKVRTLIDLPRFLEAMEARGIPRPDLTHLTDEMVAALRILADPSLTRMNTRQRLAKIGISWEKYQGWLDYAPFRRKHKDLHRRTLDVAIETGDRILAEKIEEGDLNTIKYAFEMTGKFIPNTQSQTSFMAVIAMVVSVLQRRIPDALLLGDILQDLDRLIATGDAALQLPPATETSNGDIHHDERGLHAPGSGDERAPLDPDGERGLGVG